MLFFYTPKPRKFHHEYIYVDERKELISSLKEKYAAENCMPETAPDYHKEMAERVKKAMNKHKRKASGYHSAKSFPIGLAALFLVLLFIMVWFCFR